jgi:hypothetical protein
MTRKAVLVLDIMFFFDLLYSCIHRQSLLNRCKRATEK